MSIIEKLIAEPGKFSIDQLKQGVQHGVIPAYIGIPLIQDKLKQQQTQVQAAPKQPPIAQEVMQAAANDERQRAIESLRSNLPTQYAASGGIIAFAGGGEADDEEDDDEEFGKTLKMISRPSLPEFPEMGVNIPLGIGKLVRSAQQEHSVKYGNEPKVTHGEGVKTTEEEGVLPRLLRYIQHKESRGQQYDKEGKLLTSSKGALSSMQVMPGTLRNPGFGVEPAKSMHPDEIDRVGRDYFSALYNKYKDAKLAAIAYNWGPSNTDKWLTSGGKISNLPQETQKYISGFAHGGAVQHFQVGGSANFLTKEDVQKAYDEWQAAKSPWYLPTPMAGQGAAKELEKNYMDILNRWQRQSAASPASVPSKSTLNVPSTFEGIDMSGGAAGRPVPQDQQTMLDKYEQLFKDRAEQLKKSKEEDKWLAILQGGLGMMGGTSPYAAANIGQGATLGVRAMMDANKERAAEERANLTNQLNVGLAKEKMAITKGHYDDWLKAHEQTNALQERIYGKNERSAVITGITNVLGKVQAEIKTLRTKPAAMLTPEEKQALEDLTAQEQSYFNKLATLTGVEPPKGVSSVAGKLSINPSGKMTYGY